VQTVVARIWFDSGKVETRPVEWVHFIDMDDGVPDLVPYAEALDPVQDLLFVAVRKVLAIQLSYESFTPKSQMHHDHERAR
jgi:hypothetical protein